jgi:Ca2+-binding RTX toxin-like protein
MPQTVIPTNSIGVHKVTSKHFSFNYVFDFERIGTQRWEKFDEIVGELKPQYLRYPGGTQLETVFDFQNPNKGTAIRPDGSLAQITGLHDFLGYANTTGIDVIIGVPVTQLLTQNDPYGRRGFDGTKEAALREYVREAIKVHGGAVVSDIELGNEYEGYMTSEEYGRVASRAAKVIQEEIDLLVLNGSVLRADEPRILVQVWGQSIHGALSFNDLTDRNAKVIREFSVDELAAVDGVVSHYYYRNGADVGEITANTIDNLEYSVELSASLFQPWSLASGRDMFGMFSEWNTSHTNPAGFGAKQASLLVDLFGTFVSSGVDALSFWSAQYHATSLADNGGRLMAAGVVFELLRDNLEGMSRVDYEDDVEGVGIQVFSQEDRLVLVVNSQTASINDLQLDLGVSNLRILGTQRLNADLNTADGVYKNWTGLDAFSDPDVQFNLQIDTNVVLSGDKINLEVSPFEIILIEILLSGSSVPQNGGSSTDNSQSFVSGPSTSQFLGSLETFGSLESEIFVGYADFDAVHYSRSSEALTLNLLNPSQNTGAARGDTFSGFEAFIGTVFGDTMLGTRATEHFFGGLGNDSLYGDDGIDYLYGGAGDDSLFGGLGDDLIDGGAGQDSIDGGLGFDVLQFTSAAGVIVDLQNESLNRGDAQGDSIRSVEGLRGSSWADTFFGDAGGNLLVSDGGADSIDGRDGHDSLFGGAGDDTLIGGGGNDLLDGGSGADVILGGLGFDTLHFSQTAVTVDLLKPRSNRGDAAGDIIREVEMIVASEFSDVLSGDSSANFLSGNGGDDVLSGRIGNDTLLGGNGSDTISGGKGLDQLYGGAGADQFIFGNGDGSDLIYDFSLLGGDKIVLAESLFESPISADQVVLRYCYVSGGNVVLDFGDGDLITLVGLSAMNGLAASFLL